MGIGPIGAQSIDAILSLVALEALALLAYRFATGRGPSPMPMLFTLLAGGFLLLALRAALSGAGAPTISAFAGAAFVAHGADLASRWAGAAPAQAPRMRATIALKVPEKRTPASREALHG